MTAPRIAAYSVEHLLAEVAAYPFASEAAFGRAVIDLDRNCSGDTGALWRDAERDVLHGFPASSIDEITNLRDRLWFPTAPPSTPPTLGAVLQRLAEDSLALHGCEARPKLLGALGETATEEIDGRWLWRWLSFALPPDLLLASTDSAATRLNWLSPGLEREMQKGYAQVHAHLGACLAFHDHWVGAMFAAANGLSPVGLASPGAAFAEGQDFAEWLLRTALVRLTLAQFLASRGPDDDLAAFLASSRGSSPAGRSELRLACTDLLQGRLTPNAFRLIQATYRTQSELRGQATPKNVGAVQALDPLAFTGAFPPGGGTTPEMRFVSAALKYAAAALHRDCLFERLFWQIVRVRVAFYRHVTQRPLTPGLLWFIRFYSRIKATQPWSKPLLLDSAAQLDGVDAGLRSLEVRTSPGNDTKDLRRLVLAVEESRRAHLGKGTPVVEFGIVLHFAKARGGGTSKGVPEAYWTRANADPDPRGTPPTNPSGYRYQAYYAAQCEEARVLGRLLIEVPLALTVVRGLDVCTDEIGVPTWVLVPLLEYVRACGEQASKWLAGRWGLRVPPLRTTAHAGEDFVHLLSGLRRVDEALRYLGVKEGDRLGHAVALGTDPLAWARRVGSVLIPAEERLFDLVWEWRTYAEERSATVSQQRLPRLEKEMDALAGDMFGKGHDLTAPRLVEFVDGLHDPRQLAAVGFPHGQASGQVALSGPAVDALSAYLTSPQVFKRGHALVAPPARFEGEVLAELQRLLRAKVARLGIAVEANPSSNLLIGDLTDLRQHPLWRLDPPDTPETNDGLRITVCVGSDDPLTFATTLPQEYQLLHDTLVRAGMNQADSLRWLDRIRDNGLRCRFTLPITEPIEVMAPLGPPSWPPPLLVP